MVLMKGSMYVACAHIPKYLFSSAYILPNKSSMLAGGKYASPCSVYVPLKNLKKFKKKNISIMTWRSPFPSFARS